MITKYLFELLDRYQLERPVYHISKVPGSTDVTYYCSCDIPDFFIEVNSQAATPGLAKLLATYKAFHKINDLHLLPKALPCQPLKA